MVTNADSGKHPQTRRGHPERSGAELIVRQALWHVFDYIEAEGDAFLYKEIVDCLEDELLETLGHGLLEFHEGIVAALGGSPVARRERANWSIPGQTL